METVQTVSTQDGKRIKVKAISISNKKLESDQKTAIRKIMKDEIEKELKKKPFSQAIQEIIFGVLAAKIFKEIKKIGQMKRVEIVKSEVIEGNA